MAITEERIKTIEEKLQKQEIKLAEGSKDFQYIIQELKEIKSQIKPFISAKAAAAFGSTLGAAVAAAIITVWGG